MVSATSTSASDAATISRATELLRLTVLSDRDQLLIEYAIGLVCITQNLDRRRAALFLHDHAFPN